jgi:EEF1A lysine methyltransferase 4
MAGDSVEEYSKAAYWDDRYGKQDEDARQYEWLRRFDSLRPFLRKHLPPADNGPKILHLGNGNSVRAGA